jgi:hypothetical protein
MRTQRFGALVAAAPGGGAIIVVPFDPDGVWGAKTEHHVNGTVNGCRARVRLAPDGSGWAFTLSPARVHDLGLVIGVVGLLSAGVGVVRRRVISRTQ